MATWTYMWQQSSWQDCLLLVTDKRPLQAVTVPVWSQSFIYLSTWPCFSLLSLKNSILVPNFTLGGELGHGNQTSQNPFEAKRTIVYLPLRSHCKQPTKNHSNLNRRLNIVFRSDYVIRKFSLPKHQNQLS